MGEASPPQVEVGQGNAFSGAERGNGLIAGRKAFEAFNPFTVDCSAPKLQEMMTLVSAFFRAYFARHGHPPGRVPFVAALDDDEGAAEEDKIIERSERRRSRICEPAGRWAWELTRDFLTDIQYIQS